MNRNDARSLSEETIYELRCRAVDLKREGCTYEEVSVVLKVSISAVRKWWALYRNGGPKALRLGQRGRRQGQCRRLSSQQERMVCRMITDKRPDQLKMPFALWTRQAVQELIERQFALKMPIRTVGEYLRRWGFTPQKPRRQAYEQQPEAIKKWLDQTYPAIEARAKAQQAQIHWGDETGITGISSEDHRGRGYAPRGKTPVAKRSARRFSTSMISTITNRGKLRFMVYKGALNVELFIKFLRQLIKGANRKIFLIVDNLRVHHAKKVTGWIEAHRDRIGIFYLPSYSPELNPDEYLNNTVKANLKNLPAPRSQIELQGSLRTHLRSRQRKPILIKKLFHHRDVQYAA